MSSFPTLVNSPSSTTGLGGTTISLTTASNSSSRQSEYNNFNRRVPVVGLSSSSAPSLPSLSSSLMAMTTKKRRHLPFELVYELLKWMPENDCHRIVYRFPWLCYLCTKDRHKYWRGEKHYQQLLRNDRRDGALDIWEFQECQSYQDFINHTYSNKILKNAKADANSTDFCFSVRLHPNNVHRQQILNNFLVGRQPQIEGSFHMISFTYNNELSTHGDGHRLEAFDAEFANNLQLNDVFRLIRALIAAMNRAELDQLAVLNGQNPANWM